MYSFVIGGGNIFHADDLYAHFVAIKPGPKQYDTDVINKNKHLFFYKFFIIIVYNEFASTIEVILHTFLYIIQ